MVNYLRNVKSQVSKFKVDIFVLAPYPTLWENPMGGQIFSFLKSQIEGHFWNPCEKLIIESVLTFLKFDREPIQKCITFLLSSNIYIKRADLPYFSRTKTYFWKSSHRNFLKRKTLSITSFLGGIQKSPPNQDLTNLKFWHLIDHRKI